LERISSDLEYHRAANLTGSRRLANEANVDIISSVIRSGIPIRRSAAHFSMIRAYQMMGTKRTDRRDGQIFQSFRFSRYGS
jgi:hypothetical protein